MEKIPYDFKPSLVERQTQAESQMLEELRRGEYTIEHPLIKWNPYFISPLSAVVLFRTEQPTAVVVPIRGKERAGDIRYTFPPALEHVLPVLGLYPGENNQVELSVYQGRTVQLRIPVPPLDKRFDRLICMETTPEYLGNELIFLTPAISMTGESPVCAYDYRGDLRWCLDIPVGFD